MTPTNPTTEPLIWKPITRTEPPRDVVVLTKIDDERGPRNEQPLKRLSPHGQLWFYPDGSMYVYYTPTHYAEQA
jgi:hypothetical protein